MGIKANKLEFYKERIIRMSIEKKTYIIYGYDLSARRDEIMTEEICGSKLHDEMTYNQQPGKVQIFDDPMCGAIYM